jgi:hypothetical protein
MDPSSTEGTSSSIGVKIQCLKCHMIFVGTKVFKGPRGCFHVKSRGLALHFHTNNCDNPCAHYYRQNHLTTTEFTSSLFKNDLCYHRQPPLAQPLFPSLPPSDSEEYDQAGYFNEDDTPPITSFPMSQPAISLSQKFYPSPDVALPSSFTRDLVAPGRKPSNLSLNHHKLDHLLFCQILTPYIPSSLVLKPPSYSFLACLLHPNELGTCASLNVDQDEEDSEDEDDVEDDKLDKEDKGSLGSYQSLADNPDNDADPPEVDFTNWMVAKRLAFLARERTQASATA